MLRYVYFGWKDVAHSQCKQIILFLENHFFWGSVILCWTFLRPWKKNFWTSMDWRLIMPFWPRNSIWVSTTSWWKRMPISLLAAQCKTLCEWLNGSWRSRTWPYTLDALVKTITLRSWRTRLEKTALMFDTKPRRMLELELVRFSLLVHIDLYALIWQQLTISLKIISSWKITKNSWIWPSIFISR